MSSSRKTTTQEVIPPWLKSAAQEATSSAQEFYKKPYVPYTGERVAGLSADTNTALSGLRNYLQNPGSQVERFMNPYVDSALQPAIREINKAADTELLGNQASAQFSGGYNDARHGINDVQLNSERMNRIGDITAETYGKAYESGQQSLMNALSGMFSAGNITQENQQARYDAAYDAYLRKEQDPYDRLAAFVSAISGVPYNRQTTQTQPSAGPWGIIGSVLGGMLGGF